MGFKSFHPITHKLNSTNFSKVILKDSLNNPTSILIPWNSCSRQVKYPLFGVLFKTASADILAGNLGLSVISEQNSRTAKPQHTKTLKPFDRIGKPLLDNSSKYFLLGLASVSGQIKRSKQ